MSRVPYTLDPDGDVLIIFTPSLEPFAPWDGNEEKNEDIGEGSEAEILIRVSGKHLALGSPLFRQLLAEPENVPLQRLIIKGWHTKPFMILLYILHCQLHEVPQTASIELLPKVAVLAEHYKCGPAVLRFLRLWAEPLKKELPEATGCDLIIWIFVSCYLELLEEFKKATQRAMTLSKGPIRSLGLPIRNDIMSQINATREAAIYKVASGLDEALNSSLKGERGCCYTCSSIMFGSLSMSMESTGLLALNPPVKMSYSGIIQAVRSFKCPVWHKKTRRGNIARLDPHRCEDSTFQFLHAG